MFICVLQDLKKCKKTEIIILTYKNKPKSTSWFNSIHLRFILKYEERYTDFTKISSLVIKLNYDNIKSKSFCVHNYTYIFLIDYKVTKFKENFK